MPQSDGFCWLPWGRRAFGSAGIQLFACVLHEVGEGDFCFSGPLMFLYWVALLSSGVTEFCRRAGLAVLWHHRRLVAGMCCQQKLRALWEFCVQQSTLRPKNKQGFICSSLSEAGNKSCCNIKLLWTLSL